MWHALFKRFRYITSSIIDHEIVLYYRDHIDFRYTAHYKLPKDIYHITSGFDKTIEAPLYKQEIHGQADKKHINWNWIPSL